MSKRGAVSTPAFLAAVVCGLAVGIVTFLGLFHLVEVILSILVCVIAVDMIVALCRKEEGESE